MKLLSFVLKLEKSRLLDIATVVVLLMDALIIYGSLGWKQRYVFGFSTDPGILAVHLTVLMIAVYGLETVYDSMKGSSGYR